MQRAVEASIGQFAGLDAVHNNAGLSSPSKPLHETTEDEWDRVLRENLKSVYLTTRFAFSALATSKGCILNTASKGGIDRAGEPCGVRCHKGRNDFAHESHGPGLRAARH